MYWVDCFTSLATKNFPGIEEWTLKKLAFFGEELLKWNRSINLISRKNSEKLLVKLIIDSLLLLNIIKGSETFLDIGAGAGFPSIPVLAGSQARGTLAEARRKRATFLRHILQALAFPNARVLRQAITRNTKLEVSDFDYIWSKAGLPLEELFVCADNWLRQGGCLLVFRPFRAQKEKNLVIDQARSFHLTYEETKIYEIHEISLIRTFTLFKKSRV